MRSSVPDAADCLPLSAMFERELASIDGSPPAQAAVEASMPSAAGSAGPAGPDFWLARPPRDLCGLALSGGGMRSATFNLGLLQGLAELGLLGHFDYLSTVSGGGYIGGFWSRWRWRGDPPPGDQDHKEEPVFPRPAHAGAEARAVRHLREFSNFLSPRLGFFTMEAGTTAAVVVASMVPSLLGALSLILLVLYAWVAFAWLLFTRSPAVSAACLVGAAAAIQLLFEVAWRRCSKAERRGSGAYAAAVLLALAVAAAAWWALGRAGVLDGDGFARSFARPFAPLGPHLVPDTATLSRFLAALGTRLGGALFAPAGAMGAAALALVLARWLGSRWWTTFPRRAWRGAIDRALSRTLFALAAWVVIAGLWRLAAWALSSQGTGSLSIFGLAGAGGALFSGLRRLVGEQPSKPRVGGFVERVKPLISQVLAYVTVAALVAGCAALIVHAAGRQLLALRLVPLWAALLGAALTLLFFDLNEVGFHAFYRARLARAYLGASNPRWAAAGNRVAADCEEDDLPLAKLPAGRPFHLICCAANDLAGDQLANLQRGARSAVLSRVGYSVGEDWSDWSGAAPRVSLASAITASGAAVNSHMGSRSMAWGPAVTFLMAALNLRLGLWLPHPRRCSGLGWASRLLAGWPFYKELLSISHAGAAGSQAPPADPSALAPCGVGDHVHLSDGGHFENLALYELVRRHCRYILVSDCGADPDVAFDDLGNAVRRVREDFGVEIAVDLRPLRPGPDGLAVQPMVAGDIHYPGGDTGILLLFKPTLVGNEPADVQQYKRRNGAFPHETTGDQFYDEAQWESYRRLGCHAARSAFQFLHQIPTACGAEVFTRARFEWLPLPAGVRETFPRLAGRIFELEERLRDERCSRLLREVYKEIDELDLQAKQAKLRAAPGGPPARHAADLDLGADELAASLQVLRLAILFMEEVFFAADLEAHADHRVNLGWLNYFARWAYAPLFRMWWPLVKTMYHARFTRFVEARFDLPRLQGAANGVEAVVGRAKRMREAGHGFAWECWERRLAAPGELRERLNGGGAYHASLYQYCLRMSYEGRRDPYDVQVALVLLRRPRGGENGIAAWDSGDFFVPPGLWGTGIGQDFLFKLTRSLQHERLLVRVAPVDGAHRLSGGPAGHPDACGPEAPVRVPEAILQRERTTEAQLYRCAGFREVWYDAASGRLLDPATKHPLPFDLDALFAEGGRPLDRAEAARGSWLVWPG